MREELINSLAKHSELDEHLFMDRSKLDQAEDEFSRRCIVKYLSYLQEERASRLEATAGNRNHLSSQISSMHETINHILNEETTLAERICTLFRKQGITIVSFLKAIGIAISTLVLDLTGGGTRYRLHLLHPLRKVGSRNGQRSTCKVWCGSWLSQLARLGRATCDHRFHCFLAPEPPPKKIDG